MVLLSISSILGWFDTNTFFFLTLRGLGPLAPFLFFNGVPVPEVEVNSLPETVGCSNCSSAWLRGSKDCWTNCHRSYLCFCLQCDVTRGFEDNNRPINMDYWGRRYCTKLSAKRMWLCCNDIAMLVRVTCVRETWEEQSVNALGRRTSRRYRTNNTHKAIISRDRFLVITSPSLKRFSEVCCGLLRFSLEIELMDAALGDHWVHSQSSRTNTTNYSSHTRFDFTLKNST